MHRATAMRIAIATIWTCACTTTSDTTSTSCTSDDDCVLIGPSCCDCPTGAIAATSPEVGACDDVSCPGMLTCTQEVYPHCDLGACVAACIEIECDTSCLRGFAIDPANGCVTCECASSPTPAPDCTTDADCARAPADCCGCALGGSDLAIDADQLARYSAQHRDRCAQSNPAAECPGSAADTCDPQLAPRCELSQCVLVTPDHALPANACGVGDLPVCPANTVCILNVDPDASLAGAGVCVSP